MEEMREAAMACYANMSNEQQQLVVSFFNSIDAEGDGKVSTAEYLDFLKTKGWCQKEVPQNLFEHVDADNDGTLDFEECVTFYYLITFKRFLFCKGCGLHFVCVECHKKEKSYDLCSSCYHNKNFSHAHSSFLDNNTPLQPNQPSKREKWKRRTKKVVKFGGLLTLQLAGAGFFGSMGN
ncbi:uncharacterized protein LOC131316316 [Rhododendron vialii]|uniref:uncharacterized protein LOC131316316 n=1 Tax=Rhododendron vialii TaxID=182163 RepID=UPI00265FFEA2|nr:uncharacterized protein LOC131316316 [Rhododendron vialii]